MLGHGFALLLFLLLLAFPKTELVISHIHWRLFLVAVDGVSVCFRKLEFGLLLLFFLLFFSLCRFELSRFFGLESFAFSTFFLVWAFELGRRFRRTFRLNLFGIAMWCLNMSVANREGLADLLSVICVFLRMLLSNSTLQLPVVIKVLFLFLLMLILIMVSLFTHMTMVLAVFAVAMSRVSNFIFSKSGSMQQPFLHIKVRIILRARFTIVREV